MMNEDNLLYTSRATTFSFLKGVNTDDITDESVFEIGMESNYTYDIVHNGKVCFKDRKSYVLDFLFNIAIFNDIGYSYKINVVKSYYSNNAKYKIYCDPDILLKRIKNKEIKDFENNFFKYIFQRTSQVQLIESSWKDKSINENIKISKQPKNFSIKLFEYQLKSLAWMKQIEDQRYLF